MKELGNRTHERRSDENPDKRLDEDSSERALTAANALTFLRIIAIPVVLLLLLEGEDALAATVFTVAAVTDFLDSRLARRRGGSGTMYLGTRCWIPWPTV